MTAIVSYGLFTVNSGLRFLSTNEEIVATHNLARPRLLFKLGRFACMQCISQADTPIYSIS